jgi:hypothetical protein
MRIRIVTEGASRRPYNGSCTVLFTSSNTA